MIINSASVGSEWFLNGIANLRDQEIRTQREISSGFRVQDAADSPSQTPELVRLGASLASQQAYQTNLARVQAETNAADSALSTSLKLLDSARTLGLQGAGTIATPAERKNLALQIESIQQQFVDLANTSVEGRYIFGGDQDGTPSYKIDGSSSSGVNKLTVQTATRAFSDPSGASSYQARTAAEIFDHQNSSGTPATDNAFSALQNLRSALESDDPAGITNALTSLETVSLWLNQQQAAYGVDGQRIAAEQASSAQYVTSLQTRIGDIRDTDVVQAATDLAQENTAQAAAFGAQAQISRKSLFDYLG